MTTFTPENWLVSLFGSLKDYVAGEIDAAILSPTNVPSGHLAYDVVMDFPASAALPGQPELEKTIIHFAIDDIDNMRIGLGENQFDVIEVDPTVDDPGTVQGHEGMFHYVNFDVGVWASDKSGGSTSRLRAYQMLNDILGTDIARKKCFAVTEGVEIRSFASGRFVVETLGDIRVFRIVGAELVVRVVSRSIDTPDVFADLPIEQDPELEIDGTVITD